MLVCKRCGTQVDDYYGYLCDNKNDLCPRCNENNYEKCTKCGARSWKRDRWGSTYPELCVACALAEINKVYPEWTLKDEQNISIQECNACGCRGAYKTPQAKLRYPLNYENTCPECLKLSPEDLKFKQYRKRYPQASYGSSGLHRTAGAVQCSKFWG